MKKSLLLIAASAALLLHAAPDAAQVFTRTTRYVDMDGNSLFYYNTGELVKLFNKLPKFVSSVATLAEVKTENVQLLKDGTTVLLNALNLEAVKAVAWSSKELPGNIHIDKSVTYLGTAAALPGIFNVAQFKNNIDLNAELSALPSDVICAVKFQAAWDIAHLEKCINASPNAQLKAYWNMFKSMVATFGADINRICAGSSGTCTVVIAGNDEASLRMTCTIPDENGSLSTLLKRFLPQDPQNAALPLLSSVSPAKPFLLRRRQKMPPPSRKLPLPLPHLPHLPPTMTCST